MDIKQIGRAGLVGWRGGLADRVAAGLEPRTRLTASTIQSGVGLLFIGIAVWYLVVVARSLARD